MARRSKRQPRRRSATLPKVTLPAEHGGGEADVIAWLWARTVRSDNAAAQGKEVPLVSSYFISTAAGRQVWMDPIVDKRKLTYRFDIHTSTPLDRAVTRAGTKLGGAQSLGVY